VTATDEGAWPKGALAGTLLVAAAASLWATFGLFARKLYEAGFSPIELASVRAFVAFVIVLPLALVTRTRLRAPPRTAALLLIFGIGFAVFELIYLMAIEAAPVSIAAALLYTAPVFVVGIAHITLREPVQARHLKALVGVLLGVFLVTGMARTLAVSGPSVTGRGVVLGLAAGFSYGVYTVLGKAAMHRTEPLPALVWSLGAAALLLMIFAPPIALFFRDASSVPWLIAIGVVPTLVPYILFLYALRYIRAGTASMVASIEPVVATVLAVLLLGEIMHIEQIAGVLLIVAAGAVNGRYR
jgi:DME family drug/metabolite transporter